MNRYCKPALAVFGAGIFFDFGCASSSIKHFEIDPQILCEGESAVVRWDASGEAAMEFTLEPTPDGAINCASRGRETFAFTLAAGKGGQETERKVEVIELHDGGAEPVAIRANAIEGADVVARGEKSTALWSDRVRVITVAVCQSRAINVLHEGKSARLPADGTPSDALDGTKLAGLWELRSPLSPDEQKDPTLRPRELEVLATFRCKKEAP